MFYHCARSLQDDGFLIHHKSCPSGLTFNAIYKKCEANQLKSNRHLQLIKPSFNKKEFIEFFHCDHNGLFPGIQ